MRPSKLSGEEREARLKHCPSWKDEGDLISRTFQFETYLDGVDFAKAVAELAEEANHHPDMLIGYRKVTVTLTTHDAGGVTVLDVELAERIEALIGEN